MSFEELFYICHFVQIFQDSSRVRSLFRKYQQSGERHIFKSIEKRLILVEIDSSN